MKALRFATALLAGSLLQAALAAPAPAAASRAGASAGYDSDADGDGGGDSWLAVSAGHAWPLAKKEGRLSASLDAAAGAVAFARLTELDRLWIELRPEVGYLVSPRVDVGLALSAEARLVEDDARSSLGWGATAKVRERISGRVDLTEYLSWRDRAAREERYSETTAIAGCSLFALLGDRWSLGAGLELGFADSAGPVAGGSGRMGAHRAASGAPGQGQGDGTGSGMGSGMGTGYGAGTGNGTADPDDTLAASVSAGYEWTTSLSSFAEYVATFALDGFATRHAVSVGTSWRF